MEIQYWAYISLVSFMVLIFPANWAGWLALVPWAWGQSRARYPKFLLLGDSLFEDSAKKNGVYFLRALYTLANRRFDIILRGLCGYNTSQALKVLADIVPWPSSSSGKIRFIAILFGANDAANRRSRHHVPQDNFESNLEAIITHPNVRAHNATIFLITPPPLDEIRHKICEAEKGREMVRTAANSKLYSEAVRTVASRHAIKKLAENRPQVVLIDLYKALMELAIKKTPGHSSSKLPLGYPGGRSGYLDQLLLDGLHLTEEAYEVLYQLLEAHVKPWADSQGWVLPDWSNAPSMGN